MKLHRLDVSWAVAASCHMYVILLPSWKTLCGFLKYMLELDKYYLLKQYLLERGILSSYGY